jgi:molybdopterin-guanine dinucleotide biosynthesis protein A
MGANKSFVKLDGKPLIEIVLKKVTDIFENKPVIITNQPDNYQYLGCDMVGDIFKDKGPLGGIHAGLIHSSTPYIFIVACDMPFIEQSFIQYMAACLAEEDILIPRNGESVEPLHAIYSKQCLPAIEKHLQAEHRRVQSFFQDVTAAYVDYRELARQNLSGCYFMNVNTMEDLVQAKEYIEQHSNY